MAEHGKDGHGMSLGALILSGLPLFAGPALAAHGHRPHLMHPVRHAAARHAVPVRGYQRSRFLQHTGRHPIRRIAYRFTYHRDANVRGISCVPFARANSGIELTGNADTWWNGAAGVYARGHQPEIGSVLDFRSIGRMRLGHVAVVSNIIAPRLLQVDQANWTGPGLPPGRVSRGVEVMDVSPDNDWTAVRVAVHGTDHFGSVYPTYGFIYDRADTSTMVARAKAAPASAPWTMQVAEVAELPEAALRPAPFRHIVHHGYKIHHIRYRARIVHHAAHRPTKRKQYHR